MQTLKEFLDQLTPEALVERLKLALDGSGLGIWDWDLRDNSVQFDQRWCEMLGLDHASTPMTLETWSSRVHPDDLQRCYDDIKAHLAGQTPVYENVHRMKHADGQWRFILDRGRVSGRSPDGSPIRFTGTHTDITATEQARRVLAEHDQAMQALVANLPGGVAMLDPHLKYLTASRRWCEALGVTLDQVRGRAFGAANPAEFTRWGPVLHQALAGQPSHAEEELVSQANESPRYSRWDTRPWLKADGSIGGVIISEEDVTQRVLERERAERERNARLSTLALFSGGIAHEINSPLQIILNEAELGQHTLDLQPTDFSSLRESFEAIETTARRAAAITRALRTLSRDARSDAAVPVPLQALLTDAMALTRSRFASAGVTLTLEDRAGDVQLLGRPSELLHVLLNVLNNAYDAVLPRSPAWIRLEVDLAGSEVILRCVDSGPGVAPEHASKLMTPFFTTKPHGTGLGLSLSRALVERDGGSLRHVPNAPASTFEVVVPLIARRAAPAHPPGR